MQQNAAMRIRAHFKTPFVSLVSVVQSQPVTPFFASTESQESKADISLNNRTWLCALGPFLRPNLHLYVMGFYLSLLSTLSVTSLSPLFYSRP